MKMPLRINALVKCELIIIISLISILIAAYKITVLLSGDGRAPAGSLRKI